MQIEYPIGAFQTFRNSKILNFLGIRFESNPFIVNFVAADLQQLSLVVKSFTNNTIHFTCDYHLIISDGISYSWSLAIPFFSDFGQGSMHSLRYFSVFIGPIGTGAWIPNFGNIVIKFESWLDISTIHCFIINLFTDWENAICWSDSWLGIQTETITFLKMKGW